MRRGQSDQPAILPARCFFDEKTFGTIVERASAKGVTFAQEVLFLVLVGLQVAEGER